MDTVEGPIPQSEIMTPAELRILINVRAAEARRMLGKLNAALRQLETASVAASNALRSVTGTISSATLPIRTASAEMANLARSMAAIGKGKAATSITAVSVASEKAWQSMMAAARQAEHFATALTRAGFAAERASAGLARFTASGASVKATGTAFASASVGVNRLNRAVAASTASALANAPALRNSGAAAAGAGASAAAAATGYRALSTAAAASTRASAAASAAQVASSASAAAAIATQSTLATRLAASSEAARKYGSRMQWAGRQVSMFFTAPTALAIGLGAKFALDLEKQQTQLAKVYNDSGKSVEQFNNELKDLHEFFEVLSNKTGVSQEEITGIGAAWAQAGKDAGSLAKYTQLTTEAMIIGDITAQEAQESMQALSLQWGIGTAKSKTARGEMTSMTDAVGLMNVASNITQVSYGDLITAMSKTGATARGVGMTFQETVAAMTSLVRVTGSAATAGNGLKSILSRLLAPTNEAKEAMLELGAAETDISSSDSAMLQMGIDADSAAWRMKPAAERLKEIAERYKGLDAQSQADFAKPFAGLFQIDKFRQLMADLGNEQGNYNKVLEATGDQAKNFETYQKELTMFLESNPRKMSIAGQMIKNALIDVVIPLLPHIVALAGAIGNMAQKFSEMNPHVQKFILIGLVIVALIGPLAMIIASFQVLFGVLGGGLAKVLGFFMVTRTAADGTTVSFGRFTRAGRLASAANKRDTAAIAAQTRASLTAARREIVNTSTVTTTSAARNTAAVSESQTIQQRSVALGSRAQFVETQRNAAAASAAIRAAAATDLATVNASQTSLTAAYRRGTIGQLAAVQSGQASLTAAYRAGSTAALTTVGAGQGSLAAAYRRGTIGQVAAVRAAAPQIAAAQRQVMTVQTQAIALGSRAQFVAQQRNMAQQAAAVRAGGAGVVAAQTQVATAQTAAAARGGGAAGAAAAGGASRGFKGKMGGLLTVLTLPLMLLPASWTKAIGSGIKAAGTAIADGAKAMGSVVKNHFAKMGGNGAKGFGRGLVKGLGGKGGWIGAAVAAIVGGIIYAWDEIKARAKEIFSNDSKVPILARPFVFAVDVIVAALKKLPEVAKDVFLGLVQMIVSAAKAVYKAFSYINPFAHHSPSLVENVTNGMAVVTGVFSDASGKIQSDIKDSYRAILQFGKATAGLDLQGAQLKKNDDKAVINKADPSGISAKAYDRLDMQILKLEDHMVSLNERIRQQKTHIEGLEKAVENADRGIESMNTTLEQLQKTADATGKALDYAKEQLDYYANAPIQGMRAMSDAIFENEMAQKAFQLQIMKLEDAGDSVEDLQDKFARLQGQIESLSGERADLQAKGAGSDILSTYDKMIAELKAQQTGSANQGIEEINVLNKQLDELKRKGEYLDLEQSLAFDPLTRQIDQMVNSAKELPFDQIVSGVRTYKGAVDGLTIANDAANAAVERQSAAIETATAARDLMQKGVDAEKTKLDELTSTYDSVKLAIDDMQQAQSNIVSQAGTINEYHDKIAQEAKDAADALEELGAAGDALAEGGGFEVPGLDAQELEEDIAGLTEELENGIKDAFGKLDIGKWLKEIGGKIAKGIKGLWREHIKPALDTLPGQIGQWLIELPGKLGEASAYFMGYMAGLIVKGVVGALVGLYKLGQVVIEAVDKAFGAVVKWIEDGGIGRLWDTIWGILFDEKKRDEARDKMFEFGKNLVGGLLGGIWNAMQNIGQWIWDHMITPLLDGFKDGLGIHSPSTVFFAFGGDILQGLLDGLLNGITAVLTWFADLPRLIFEAIGDLKKWIGDKFEQAINWLRENIPIWFEAVLQWFRDLPGNIVNAVGDIATLLGDKFQGAFDAVTAKLTSWKDTVVGVFQSLPGAIGSAMSTIGDHVKVPVNWVVDNVYNKGIRKIWNNTASKIPGIGDMPEMDMLASGGSVGGRIVGPGTGTSDSIFTMARPGSEIFTAREVSNAGGFSGLEKLLANRGVGSANHSSGNLAPVMLSNGEYKLAPEQVAKLGGTAAVRDLRGRLAAGQIPGHFPGGGIIGDIVDVATNPIDAISDGASAVAGGARKAAAAAMELALNALKGTVPDELSPPGGAIGRLPKNLLNTVSGGLVDAIRGDSKLQGKAGNIGQRRYGGTIPRFATGGTVPSAGSSSATSTATSSGDSGAEGLAENVEAATVAAKLVWDTYYKTTESAQKAHNSAEAAAQLAADAVMLATRQTAADTAVATNAAMLTAISTANATHRSSELAADSAYYTTTLSADSGFKSSLVSNQANFVKSMMDSWASLRTQQSEIIATMATETTDRFRLMSDDLNAIVTGPITDTMNTFDPLLRTVVGWFDAAATDIGSQWERVKPGVADPSRFVINEVYDKGIRGAWDQVHTWLDLPPLNSFVAGFASGGAPGMVDVNSLSNPNSPKSVKNGGPLRAASGSRDSTLFAGMRGEYVLNKDQVKQWGGIGQLEQWRKNAIAGTRPMEGGGQFSVPGFAGGGALHGNHDTMPGVIKEVPKRLAKYKDGPYQYGGGGTPGYDCSGWTGAVHKLLLGQSEIGRIWTTEDNFSSFGYKRGKDGYWSMGVHNGGGGMNSHTAGTLAGDNYESGGAHNTSTWGQRAAGTVHPQFENQYYLPDLGGKFVGSAGGGAYEPIEPRMLKMWDDYMRPFKDAANAFGGGALAGQYPEKGFDKFNLLRGVVQKKASEKDAEARASQAAAMAFAGSSSDDVERWRSVVQSVLRDKGLSQSLDEITLRRMQRESSGNPRAINLDDENAMRGTPSKGLMQVIDPTFQDYRDPRYPNDIWDPQANIAASMNWALSRYGSLEAAYGQAGGYDKGGWLEPGVTAAVNATGKPEAILTNQDWKAIYQAANNPLTADTIAEGFIKANSKMFGFNVERTQIEMATVATEAALQGENKKWNPVMVGAANATTVAANSTTNAVKNTTAAVNKTNILSEQTLAQMEALKDVMINLSGLTESTKDGVTFAAISPLLNSIGALISTLPDAEPTYVAWAGTSATVTKEMKREKQMNDLKNAGKGIYQAFKDVSPVLLKHTAVIGSAVEQLVAQDAAAWTQAIGMITAGNPMGALILVPVILKEILTVLPLIINAILDIVPAIMQALIGFVTRFEPDSVYAYDSYEAASDAVAKNQAAIRQGASAPYFVPSENSVQQQNQSVEFNFYGDVSLPNVTNESGAKNLVDNLFSLSGGS